MSIFAPRGSSGTAAIGWRDSPEKKGPRPPSPMTRRPRNNSGSAGVGGEAVLLRSYAKVRCGGRRSPGLRAPPAISAATASANRMYSNLDIIAPRAMFSLHRYNYSIIYGSTSPRLHRGGESNPRTRRERFEGVGVTGGAWPLHHDWRLEMTTIYTTAQTAPATAFGGLTRMLGDWVNGLAAF